MTLNPMSLYKHIHLVGYCGLLLILLLTIPDLCLGQKLANPLPSNRETKTQISDLQHLAFVSRDFLTAPVRFETIDWYRLIGTMSITSLLFSVDPAIDKCAMSYQSSTNDQIFGLDKQVGGTRTLYFTLGIYGAGLISGESKLRRSGLMAFEAFMYSKAVTKLLKLGFGRVRPNSSRDALDFYPFHGGDFFSSLPSGHTTAAFSVAIVLSHTYDHIVWKGLWYGGAALVGLSRVYNHHHWFSDTFLSFAISYSIAEFVVHYGESEKHAEPGAISTSISPIVDPGIIGIALTMRK